MIKTTSKTIRSNYAEDLTHASDARCREIRAKRGFEILAFSAGVYGINCLFMTDNEGNYYKTSTRCQNNYILM